MTPRTRRTSSPDPLATPLEDCIYVPPSPPPLAPESTVKRPRPTTPKSGPSTPTPRKARAVVQLVSSRKRRRDEDTMLMDITGDDDFTQISTPDKAIKKQNGVSSPRVKSDIKGKGKAIAVVETTPEKSRSLPTTTPARSARKTLASGLKPLPTPSPLRPKSTIRSGGIRNFDEAFIASGAKPLKDPFGPTEDVIGDAATGTSPSISREVFLANEALRRQREARNFRYEGDVDAPKLTRSGRVVGADKINDANGMGEGDEYGLEDGLLRCNGEDTEGLLDEPSLNGLTEVIPAHTVDMDNTGNPDLKGTARPLPLGARRHILNILSTLTGQNVGQNPPPFRDEETNEALQGLVNLLRGTVERGEGNSALLVGPRGTGKTRIMARALNLLPFTSKTAPIVVYLSGHAQTNDRLATREMGRQIAEAEGKAVAEEKEEDDAEGEEQEEYAPTTLPSHLLALLTAPSPRAIIIVMEEFDLFTEHARQALLYCLLDVVQSVKTGPVESTGRGVAVIGLTSRIDTLLLLEKRVKSRFSHRVWRISSPLSPDGSGWKVMMRSVLLPWINETPTGIKQTKKKVSNGTVDEEERWQLDWEYAVEFMLEDDKVKRYLDRLTGLTTDIRHLYRPFILPICQICSGQADFLSVLTLTRSVLAQIENSGWGLQLAKLKGLSQPSLAVLVIAKHLYYAGREEFNFAQVEEEYLRFGRTRLVGSGRVRWPIGVLRVAYDHLLHLGLLVPLGHSSLNPQFAKVRCTLSPHEVVAWFKGEGANSLGTELGNWGRMMGGYA